MIEKQYYSVRSGKSPKGGRLGLENLQNLFFSVYSRFFGEGHFQEDFGFRCEDAGFLPGKLGHDLQAELLLALRKEDLWPIYEKYTSYTEDDIFDLVEFLYDHVSKPTKREYHSWNDCGWHCSEFDRASGQLEFREQINRVLNIYSTGFELSAAGYILSLPESGLDALVSATIPSKDPDNINARIQAAVDKFRRSRGHLDDRRDAVRDLFDVLEYLRPKAKEMLLSEDERELFNMANNFGLRHHNPKQKTNYDKPIWYSWMFYHQLATIHALIRLIDRKAPPSRSR